MNLVLPLLLMIPATAPSQDVYVHVPVYAYFKKEPSALQRNGTISFRLTEQQGAPLYCIAYPPSPKVTCVIRTPQDSLILVPVTITTGTQT